MTSINKKLGSLSKDSRLLSVLKLLRGEVIANVFLPTLPLAQYQYIIQLYVTGEIYLYYSVNSLN